MIQIGSNGTTKYIVEYEETTSSYSTLLHSSVLKQKVCTTSLWYPKTSSWFSIRKCDDRIFNLLCSHIAGMSNDIPVALMKVLGKLVYVLKQTKTYNGTFELSIIDN